MAAKIVHPQFDGAWFAEVEGKLIEAGSLREMSMILRGMHGRYSIKDYFPMGTPRSMTPRPSTRSTTRVLVDPKYLRQNFKSKPDPLPPADHPNVLPSGPLLPSLREAQADPSAIVGSSVEKSRGGRPATVDREAVLDLWSQNAPVDVICCRCSCGGRTVRTIVHAGRMALDPRAMVARSSRKKFEYYEWKDRDVEKLRYYAEVLRWSAGQIAGQIFPVSRGAIVGKCHRSGVQLGRPRVKLRAAG